MKWEEGPGDRASLSVLALEDCLDFINDDELVEVTPKAIRLRKSILDPVARKRSPRGGPGLGRLRRGTIPG
jgi:hypothetical protein